jgi:hypothetical protein
VKCERQESECARDCGECRDYGSIARINGKLAMVEDLECEQKEANSNYGFNGVPGESRAGRRHP